MIKIVQITDLHLFSDIGATLVGIPTFDSAAAVVMQLLNRHKDLDAILITGDISHDETIGGYRQLHTLLHTFKLPIMCIAGNHDDHSAIQQLETRDNWSVNSELVIDQWCIVMLDSQVAGSECGTLGTAELTRLKRAVQQYPDHNMIVCLHHPIVALGSRWLDTMQLTNTEQLTDILGDAQHIRAVVFGHAHQQYDAMLGQIALFCTPSTCHQFRPGSNDFSLDFDHGPGYRIFELGGDGKLHSYVERLTGNSYRPDQATKGY